MDESRPTLACDQEAIHAPGCVQPHALLLCIDPASLVIESISANVTDLAPPGHPVSLGMRLDQVLPARVAARVAEDSKRGDGAFLGLDEASWPPFGAEIYTHRSADTLFCEIEPRQPGDQAPHEQLTLVQNTISGMREAESLEKLADHVATCIRRITGMERIMVYRFDRDGHGEVIGESLDENFSESFMDFHFPADDIPPQARALYLKSPTRFTPSRDYTPAMLKPALKPSTGLPYDMGRCRCRSVSPVHQIYQRNLGVDGSFSSSVISQGRLWGLIVGHHRQPHRVGQDARHQVMVLTDAFALALHATETTEERDARALHVHLHARLLEQIAGADDFVSPLVEGEVKLTDIFFASSGAAVVYDEGAGDEPLVRMVGQAPDREAVLLLTNFCRAHLEDGVYFSECLSAHLPEFRQYTATASGVLGITVGDTAQHMILWFRPESVCTTIWGGKSPQQVAHDKDQGDFLPRQSFARWVEVRRGHSRPWPRWKVEIARSLRTALNDVILRQLRTIRLLNLQLAESDRAKSRFLAHMSHELRTPLNAVLGFSEMLGMGLYGQVVQRQSEAIGHVRDAARHLLNMINDVLDLSKIEAGGFDIEDEELEIPALVTYAQQLLSSLTREAEVTILIEVPSALSRLRADRRMLLQILINLLSNAIKFTPPQGSVRVGCREDASGLCLSVHDTGIGIAADQLARVLEPFRQTEDNMEIARKGTGLGLPIVKSLVELHGGTLHLSSTLGQGTCVTLIFPPSRIVP